MRVRKMCWLKGRVGLTEKRRTALVFKHRDIRRGDDCCGKIERMSKKAKTPSFVTELPLTVNAVQEHVLLARLAAARQVYNACLGEAFKRREALLHSRAYQAARGMVVGKARTQAFAAANEAVGFADYALHDYAGQFGHEGIGTHLDSLTVQKLASRAFDAVQKYHFGKPGHPRFQGRNQIERMEGKT